MHPQFEGLTPQWFKRANVYTGSIGDFRYRFATDKKENTLRASVYSIYCYEAARRSGWAVRRWGWPLRQCWVFLPGAVCPQPGSGPTPIACTPCAAM